MQPLQSSDIELQGPLVNLISRNSELGTARGAYNVWHIIVSKDLSPRFCVDVFGASVSLFAEGLNFVWTAWYGDATEIGIAVTLNEVDPES